MSWQSFRRRSVCGLVFGVLALSLVGCGSGGKPTGTAKGKVTYKGEAVKTGSVNFTSTSGSAAQGEIDEDGNYQLGPVEAGDFIVYISPPIPKQLPPGTKAPPKAKFEIPKAFQAPTTSTLKVTVKAGSNDIPIDVK